MKLAQPGPEVRCKSEFWCTLPPRAGKAAPELEQNPALGQPSNHVKHAWWEQEDGEGHLGWQNAGQ